MQKFIRGMVVCAALMLAAPTVNAQDAAPDQAPGPDGGSEAEDDPMNSFGFGPRVGLIGMAQKVATSAGTVDNEFSFGYVLSLPLMFGDGHGFAFDMDPYFAGIGDLNHLGMGFSFGARFQLSGPMYLGFGAGPRFAGIFFDGGGGIFAGIRVPIDFTMYFGDMLAVVGGLGLGFGATAIVSDNVTAKGTSGFNMDLSVGIRFP